MEKTKTTVRICGRDYTITGASPEEHIKRVGVYVDRKMEELLFATRLPQPMVAVLTAMNIADELIKAQDENTRLRRELLAAQQSGMEKAEHAAAQKAMETEPPSMPEPKPKPAGKKAAKKNAEE